MGTIGAVAVLTPVVTGLIGVGVGGRIGGVLGAAMPTRGVLGAAMARGMPGAAMTTGGVLGAAMAGGVLRAAMAGDMFGDWMPQSTRGRGLVWLGHA